MWALSPPAGTPTQPRSQYRFITRDVHCWGARFNACAVLALHAACDASPHLCRACLATRSPAHFLTTAHRRCISLFYRGNFATPCRSEQGSEPKCPNAEPKFEFQRRPTVTEAMSALSREKAGMTSLHDGLLEVNDMNRKDVVSGMTDSGGDGAGGKTSAALVLEKVKSATFRCLYALSVPAPATGTMWMIECLIVWVQVCRAVPLSQSWARLAR